MTDLADWLLQQIADDEAAARVAGPGEWRRDGINSVEDSDGRLVVYGDGSAPAGAQADHIARHDPARVLAECAAKRAMLKQAQDMHEIVEGEWGCGEDCPGCETQRLLAQPYADRPGFDPAWRVDA